jgi:phosphocarrier protein
LETVGNSIGEAICGTNGAISRSISIFGRFAAGRFLFSNRRRFPMQTRELPITNRLGLHARACARIVQIASKFRCNVSLVAKGRRASARNIVAVMLLTASVGTTVRLEIDGPDEAEAMRAISALFHDGFGERS